jgi:hypothetical protein
MAREALSQGSDQRLIQSGQLGGKEGKVPEPRETGSDVPRGDPNTSSAKRREDPARIRCERRGVNGGER